MQCAPPQLARATWDPPSSRFHSVLSTASQYIPIPCDQKFLCHERVGEKKKAAEDGGGTCEGLLVGMPVVGHVSGALSSLSDECCRRAAGHGDFDSEIGPESCPINVSHERESRVRVAREKSIAQMLRCTRDTRNLRTHLESFSICSSRFCGKSAVIVSKLLQTLTLVAGNSALNYALCAHRICFAM